MLNRTECVKGASDNISVSHSEMLTAGLNRMLADANLDAIKTNMSTAQAKIFNREKQSRLKRKLGQSVNCLYSIASQLSLNLNHQATGRKKNGAGDQAPH